MISCEWTSVFILYICVLITIIYHTKSVYICLTHPGYEFDLSPEPDLLSLTETQFSSPQLEKILEDLTILKLFLQEDEIEAMAQKDWLALCYKVDKFLFRIYLLIFTVYSSTLLLLWSSWSSSWRSPYWVQEKERHIKFLMRQTCWETSIKVIVTPFSLFSMKCNII